MNKKIMVLALMLVIIGATTVGCFKKSQEQKAGEVVGKTVCLAKAFKARTEAGDFNEKEMEEYMNDMKKVVEDGGFSFDNFDDQMKELDEEKIKKEALKVMKKECGADEKELENMF